MDAIISPLAPEPPAEAARDDRPTALSVENVSAAYGKNAPAIEDISFAVKTGERVAVVGPNGAGKSTLFNVIAGLLPALKGRVQVHGHTHQAGDCVSVGYVPQRENVDWRFPLTVMDVVLMGRVKQIGWLRWPGRADRAAAHEALAQVGLAALAYRPIGDLSGGQQQRVFMARALAQRANVLLLDEPFSGVDVEGQNAIFEVLDGLREANVTVVISTHDLQMATTRFDRLLLLNRRLLADGPAATVLTPERLAAAYGGRLTFWQGGRAVTVTTDDCCP